MPMYSHPCRNERRLYRVAQPRMSRVLLFFVLSMPCSMVLADGMVGIVFSRSFDKRGISIEQIIPGSPADDAELRTGSIVSAINGRAISSIDEFKRIVAAHQPGQKVVLTIIDGKSMTEVPLVVADSRTKFVSRPLSAEVKEALEEIRDTSGTTGYDLRRADHPLVQIRFRPRNVSNTTIRLISHLPDLKTIHFSDDVREGRKFSGAALAELARAPKFSEIIFEEYLPEQTLVDESVVASLARIPQLRSLKVWGGNLSPAAVAGLSKLTQLTTLSLRNTPLTDEGLEAVGQLTNLQVLDLYGTKITGASLKKLQGLKKLTDLDLERVPVQNDDLASLTAFTDLTVLDLSRSQVTDSGLKHLSGLSKLTFLGLNYTGEVKDTPLKSGGDPAFELIERVQYELFPKGAEVPISTSGITVQGLAENLKDLRMLKRLEVKGPDLEPSDVRGLGKIWPMAFIESNRKTIEPPKEQ